MRETWWIAEDAEGVLERAALVSVAGCMTVAAGGERLSSDRQSAAVRLNAAPPLLVKWRRPRPGRRWKTWWRASRERCEAAVALQCLERGIETPAPLAVGERREGPRLVGSVLVRPYLEGVETADRWLSAGPRAERVLDLVRALARWHDAGFRHGDCYPKNVLMDLETGRPMPIGAPYGTFTAPGPRLDRARARDLAQWIAGLEDLGFAAAVGSLTPYAEAVGLGAAVFDAVPPHLARIRARKAARRASQPRREPHGAPLPAALPPDQSPVERRVRPLRVLRVEGGGRRS